MSRRQNQSENRVEQNRATLKSLVKLESNKSCADCKKNKHPRWASWNLGIFVCIRCSGIHRGMGTHISRVKSVDLDSWTDEQTQSMLKWGNARANVYWEAKLAPGHVPSESKIENFIRTKYESKRWVMDGPMPDPSTLGDGAELPSTSAQQSTPIERSSSQRQPARASRQPTKPGIDLFGDDISGPARPSTGPPIGTQPPPKAAPAPAKQSKPAESLLGLDFFSTAPAPPNKPSSDLGPAGVSTGPSKADLKQSILSLYATAPKPSIQSQNQATSSVFSSLGSTTTQPVQAQQTSSFGGLGDAFSSLNIASSSTQQQSKPSAFSDLAGLTSQKQTTSTAPSFGAGGSFFDPVPKSPPANQSAAAAKPKSDDFSSLFSSTSPPTQATKPVQSKPASTSLSSDLFDFSSPAPPAGSETSGFSSLPTQPASTTSPTVSSAFNLSSNTRSIQPVSSTASTIAPVSSSGFSGAGSGLDAWGSSDVWGTSDPAPPISTATTSTAIKLDPMDGGWGTSSRNTKPAETTITADEDFGGWNSAPTVQASSTTNTTTKPSGAGFGGGNDDLFGNVWG